VKGSSGSSRWKSRRAARRSIGPGWGSGRYGQPRGRPENARPPPFRPRAGSQACRHARLPRAACAAAAEAAAAEPPEAAAAEAAAGPPAAPAAPAAGDEDDARAAPAPPMAAATAAVRVSSGEAERHEHDDEEDHEHEHPARSVALGGAVYGLVLPGQRLHERRRGGVEAGVELAGAEGRDDDVADDPPGEGVGHRPLGAVAGGDEHLPVLDADEDDDAVVEPRLPDAPRLPDLGGDLPRVAALQ